MTASSLRLDKWLWHARFYKSRSLAARHCETAAMRINGSPVAKAHYLVREGDVLTFVWHGRIRVVQVLALGSRRGPAVEAQSLYANLEAGGAVGHEAPLLTDACLTKPIPSGS